MTRIEVNVQTGEQTIVELSPEEQAEAEARAAAEAAALALSNHPDTLEVNAQGYLNGGNDKINLRKVVKAKMISDLAFRLGKAPAALTTAELLAERNRIAAIYKAL